MTLEDLEKKRLKQRCFYTKEEIKEILNEISLKVVVEELPELGVENYLYLVPSLIQDNYYLQYVWNDGSWEYLGENEVDLTEYVTDPELEVGLSKKQDKLISGTNIKTINNQSVLGDGNIIIKEEALEEKTYAPLEFSGLGRKYLQKNIVSDKNVLTQAMVSDANTEFIVQYDYDLNDPNGENPITIPANCALKFEGGSINNGKIVFQDTSLESCKECFGDDLVIEGKVLQEASPEWFSGNDAQKIKRAIDTFGVVRLAARDYNITEQIVIEHSFSLTGSGFADFFGNHSQSRLVASGTFDSIISIVKSVSSPYYSSIYIEGVSFVCSNKTGSTYNKDVDGVVIYTPSGPSRPFVVKNCSFKRLNCGIYFKGSSAETSIGNIEINSNVFTLNNWGLYGDGNGSIGRCLIVNNTLDQNAQGGICFNDDTYFPCRDYLEIKDNVLEDEQTAYIIKIRSCDTYIIGNHYENVNAAKIIGFVSIKSNVYLQGNKISSNNNNFTYTITNSFLTANDNNASGSAKYILQGVRLTDGSYRGYNLATSVWPFSASYNDDYSYAKAATTPKNVYINTTSVVRRSDERVLYSLSASQQAYPLSSLAIDSTKYYVYVFNAYSEDINNLSIASGADAKQLFSLQLPVNKGYTRNMLIIKKDASDTYNGILRITPLSPILLSDIYLYELDSYPNGLIGIDFERSVAYEPQSADLYKGQVKWYDTQKQLAHWNGDKWVDANGFTPALMRGSTAQRPTTLQLNDFGYSYYDTDLLKLIYYMAKIGSRSTLTNFSGTSAKYVSNTLTQGSAYYISLVQMNNSEIVSITFCKTNTSTDDGIPLTVIRESGKPSKTEPFIAPDPTVYPYICMKQSVGSGVHFYYLYPITYYWADYDGAGAGVLRSGDTSSRPASTDIYTGFQYFDTTLGKFICWNGSAWVNLDGTALS